MDVERIWNNEKQLLSLTGVTKLEAELLIEAFEEELIRKYEHKSGYGGRPAKLDIKGIFLMFMMFYRHYITLEALGAIFNLNNGNVKRWVDSSQEILKEVLRKKNFSHLIVPQEERLSRKPLNNKEKSILMALNSLSEGLVTN